MILDIGSPWPLHNDPDARHAKEDGQRHLTEAIRASTAARAYFEPQQIDISSRDKTVVRGSCRAMKRIWHEATADELAKIAEMDEPEHMKPFAATGQKAATTKTVTPAAIDHLVLEPNHFPGVFDIA